MNAENKGTTWKQGAFRVCDQRKIGQMFNYWDKVFEGLSSRHAKFADSNHHYGPSRLVVFCGALLDLWQGLDFQVRHWKIAGLQPCPWRGPSLHWFLHRQVLHNVPVLRNAWDIVFRASIGEQLVKRNAWLAPVHLCSKVNMWELNFLEPYTLQICYGFELLFTLQSHWWIHINNPDFLPKVWISAEGASHM